MTRPPRGYSSVRTMAPDMERRRVSVGVGFRRDGEAGLVWVGADLPFPAACSQDFHGEGAMDKKDILRKVSTYRVIDLPDCVGIKCMSQLHTLNSTAYEIFQLCDGSLTVEDILNEMQRRYPDSQVTEHVEQGIHKLHAAGLVRERNGHDFVHIIRKY